MTVDLDEGVHRWCWSVPPNHATKWDKTTFYRKAFQAVEAKAVDFAGVYNKELWLVEAKDFAREPRDPAKPPLVEEFAHKVRDTLAGVLAASKAATDPDELVFAKLAVKTTRIRVVLQFWQPDHPRSSYGNVIDAADLKKKAKTLLNKFAPQPKVICGDAQPQDNVPWTNCPNPNPGTP